MKMTKREFLTTGSSVLSLAMLPLGARRALADAEWDVIVVGAGSAGLPAAIFAAERGASVLVLEGSHRIGGTLDRSSGQMSAAGTRIQAAKGIVDSPDLHYDDVIRLSRGTVVPELVRLAVDNAADTLHWLLDLGWEPLPEHPVKGSVHEAYSVARYQWSPLAGMGVYRAIEPRVLALMAEERMTILTGMRATELIPGPGDTVSGVVATGADGEPISYEASNVVLTTGGAGGDADMFEQLNGAPLYARMAYPYNRGDGVRLAEAVGGYARGKEQYLCSEGAILSDFDFPSPALAGGATNPLIRKPWEIRVNAAGERFWREDDPSIDNREHAVLDQTGHAYWVVFDERILNEAPSFVSGWSADQMRAAFGKHHMFSSGATVDELARWAGLPGDALARSISRYNAAQKSGNDAFGREHMPLPIEQPPFYAIRLQGFSILTYGGVAVDDSLRVRRRDGRTISNLYVAGEAIGKGSMGGKAFIGGMSLTPALTFGRLITQKIIDFG